MTTLEDFVAASSEMPVQPVFMTAKDALTVNPDPGIPVNHAPIPPMTYMPEEEAKKLAERAKRALQNKGLKDPKEKDVEDDEDEKARQKAGVPKVPGNPIDAQNAKELKEEERDMEQTGIYKPGSRPDLLEKSSVLDDIAAELASLGLYEDATSVALTALDMSLSCAEEAETASSDNENYVAVSVMRKAFETASAISLLDLDEEIQLERIATQEAAELASAAVFDQLLKKA